MSLIKFLSLGQSFGGVKDEPSPYRLKQGSLPRFAAPDRPRPAIRKRDEKGQVQRMLFDNEPMPAAEPSPLAVCEVSPSAGAMAAEPELIPAAPVPGLAPTGRAPASVGELKRRAGTAAQPAAGPSGTASILRQLFPAKSALAAPVPAAVKPEAAKAPRSPWWRTLLRRDETRRRMVPTQAEMKLDVLRVARNDLSEADWELVPQRAASGRAVEWATGLWRRLAGKMSGTARARV
jgi:hypothetical protein